MRLGKNRIFNFKQTVSIRRRKIHKSKIIIAILTLILVYSAITFLITVRPLIANIAEARAKYIATIAIDTAISNILVKEKINYQDLITVLKNDKGEISGLQANTIEVNRLKSIISKNIQETIVSIDTASISFPLGNVFDNEFLSGLGPRITVKLLPVGYATVNFGSSFISSGINQTKHEIYLEVNSHISVILPGMIRSANVKTILPVVETVIVGTVPSSYTTIDGVTSNPADSALNLIGNQ